MLEPVRVIFYSYHIIHAAVIFKIVTVPVFPDAFLLSPFFTGFITTLGAIPIIANLIATAFFIDIPIACRNNLATTGRRRARAVLVYIPMIHIVIRICAAYLLLVIPAFIIRASKPAAGNITA